MTWERTTARDVAERAGVHPSTVSRSLDPFSRANVSEATRLRVERVARELGYRPDLTASSLRRRSSRTIGVLISSFSNPIYGELLHGVTDELEELGYHVLIAEVPDVLGTDRMSAAVDMLGSRRIDGLICAASRGGDAEVLRRLVDSGLPVVLSLRWIASSGIPRVVNDDALGGELAARHLLELGHRRVVEITGPTDISTFSERARGFREALATSSPRATLRSVEATTPSIDEGYRAMSEALQAGPGAPPTAVFAHNDLLAVGALTVLQERGVDCPGSVSVVGYNDSPLTGHLDPPLTTIRLQIDRMGREAARAVVTAIAQSGPVAPELSLPPDLIVRGSTAPVTGAGAAQPS